jgi:hypothetical protein
MIDKLKKMQKELFGFWRYDTPEVRALPLTPEESLEVIETALSVLSVLRYRGCESDILRKVMQEVYYELYERHPLCMTMDSRIERNDPTLESF